MGGLVSAIGSAIGGAGLKDLVLGVLDRIKLNPEERAKIQAQLDQNAHELAKMELELKKAEQEHIAKEIEVASSNIRSESLSGDKFTSRMRPSFGYLMIFILGWNYIIVPLLQRTPLEFPEALFWLFGSVMLGYTGARTWEKISIQGDKK